MGDRFNAQQRSIQDGRRSATTRLTAILNAKFVKTVLFAAVQH